MSFVLFKLIINQRINSLRYDPTQARPRVPCEKSRYVKT